MQTPQLQYIDPVQEKKRRKNREYKVRNKQCPPGHDEIIIDKEE
jgi:hypothetical protein